MNRISYNLAPLVLPLKNMPGWAEQLSVATQAVMDGQYLHGPGGLDNFYGQWDGWVQTQTVKRANTTNPLFYVPEPFRMTIPRRQLVAYDENGNMRSDVWADPDPNIHMPELPAFVEAPPKPTGTGFVVDTAPDKVMAQMMSAVLMKLMSIEQRLIAIQAARP